MTSNIINKTMFIGIGAQKTGTTWLADYLDQHPQVCISPVKELHYFDTKYLKTNFDKMFVRDLHKYTAKITNRNSEFPIKISQLLLKRLEMKNDQDYMNFFSDLVDKEEIFGEITPAYSMLDSNGFKAIKEIHPHVKFIFIMRYPIDRYWSQLRYEKKFDQSFQPLENFTKMLNDDKFLLRTDYKRTIESLKNVINDKDILYLFYEDLFSIEKGEKTVRRITDFLEIDYIKPDFGKSINATKQVALNDDLKNLALDKFRYIVEFVDQFFNGNIPKNWKE